MDTRGHPRPHGARARRPVRAHRHGRAGARRRRDKTRRMSNAARRVTVAVIVPPRALLLDIAGPLEVLRRANLEQRDVVFDVRYIGPTPLVTSSIGLALAGIEPLPPTLEDDAMVIVPGNADAVAFAADVSDAAAARDEAAIVAWLVERIGATQMLVSICSGALLAARAGLLDGYECTTHFSCCAALAALAPRARVLENRLYV